MNYQVARCIIRGRRVMFVPCSTWLTHRKAYKLMLEFQEEFPDWGFALVDKRGNWSFTGPKYYDNLP